MAKSVEFSPPAQFRFIVRTPADERSSWSSPWVVPEGVADSHGLASIPGLMTTVWIQSALADLTQVDAVSCAGSLVQHTNAFCCFLHGESLMLERRS